MKVLVCGSRSWTDDEMIHDALHALQTYEELGFGPIEIIHGGARGADMKADVAAKELGYPVQCFKPDWKRYGRSAGIVRNLEMLDQKPDLVLAFWDGVSRGTAHTIQVARERAIRVVIYHSKEETDERETAT